MSIKTLFTIVAISSLALSAIVDQSVYFDFGSLSQKTPLPKVLPGFNIGAKNTRSRLDIFFDPHCSDSRTFSMLLSKLMAYSYNGKPVKDQIGIYLHYIPLPYHYYSFHSIVALKYLEQKYQPGVIPFLERMFAQMEEFNSKFEDTKVAAVRVILEKIVQEVCPKDYPYPTDLFGTTTYQQEARLSFKYAVSKQVTGAPVLFINDVMVESTPTTFTDLSRLVLQFL